MEQQLQNSNRIEYLDAVKCFAIYCVLVGHLLQWTNSGSNLYNVIYSYHMPLFMTVSGFFLGKSLSMNFKEFISIRFRQLIIPTISFTLLFLVLKGGYTEGDMWFLKFLFVDLVLIYISKKIFRNTIVSALLPTTLLFCLTRIAIYRMIPFLWLGYFMHEYRDYINRNIKLLLPLSISVFVGLLSIWSGDHLGTKRFISFSEGMHIDMINAYSTFLQLFIGMAGSVMFILLFNALWRITPACALRKYMSVSGRNTLGIYCLQIYFIEFLLEFVPFPFEDFRDLASVVLAVPSFVILNIMVNLIDRNKWTALLLLGRKK